MKNQLLFPLCGLILFSGCKHAMDAFPPENADSLSEEQTAEVMRFNPPWPVLDSHPTDPSLKPKMLKGQFVSQLRMIADFDGNEMLDIGLPDFLDENDAFFTIYLRMADGYKNAGFWDIDVGNPTSIEYVTPPCFSRLWASDHISSREILIDYTELKNGMIVTNDIFSNRFKLSWGGGKVIKRGTNFLTPLTTPSLTIPPRRSGGRRVS
jgi:hypothetical protein